MLGDDDVIQDMISGQDRIVLMDTGGVVTNLAQLQALAGGGSTVSFANGSSLTLANTTWAALNVGDVLFVV